MSIEQATALIGILLAVVGFLLRQVFVKRLDDLIAENRQLRDRLITLEAQKAGIDEKIAQNHGQFHRYKAYNDERISKLEERITNEVIGALLRRP